MKVADLMVTDLQVVSDEATINDAIMALADAHVHGVPVVDRHGTFVGVLSTSDVLDAEAEAAGTEERENLFANTLVRELMTAGPKTIGSNEDVKVAAQQMLSLEVHRLFVVVDGELQGVISQSDIVRAVATAKI